jgi:hypothetical protein
MTASLEGERSRGFGASDHAVRYQLMDHERWRCDFRSEIFGCVERRMPGRSVGEPINSARDAASASE